MVQTMKMSGLLHSEKTSFQTMTRWASLGVVSQDIVLNTYHFPTSTPYVHNLSITYLGQILSLISSPHGVT